MLNKLLIAGSICLCAASAYLFFYERNILWGSITILASVLLSLLYALTGKVNKLPDDHTPAE